MGAHRVAAVGFALTLLALAATGCTSVGGSDRHPLAAGVSSTGTDVRSTPPAPSTPPEPVLDGVVATGTLASADGRTAGQVVLTAAGNTVTATLKGFFTAATSQLELDLSPHPQDAQCPADRWAFQMNEVDGETHSWSLPIAVAGGPFQVDPTYLRTVVLRADADAGKPNADGCVYPALALATLTWKIAPSHTGLVVTDHGPRPQATGTVTVADGQPSTYTVAPNDTIEAIRARFGITADDFYYLNPFNGMTDDSELRYGTVYNLSPTNRGAPLD